MTEDTTKFGVSRRTLAKGAAWSVPAVAVASAAPVYAFSIPPVAPDIAKSFGCKWPGGGGDKCNNPLDKGFRIYIPFDNKTQYSVIVNITGYAVTAGGDASRDFQVWNSSTLDIPAGGEKDFWITWHDDNSGNNKTMSVTYTYTVINPNGPNTTFGPYTIPVAKVFNTTCTGNPQPTVPTGALLPGSNPPVSDCPAPRQAAEPVTTQEAPAKADAPVEETKAPVEQKKAPAEAKKVETAPVESKVEETKVEAPAAEEAATSEVAANGDDA